VLEMPSSGNSEARNSGGLHTVRDQQGEITLVILQQIVVSHTYVILASLTDAPSSIVDDAVGTLRVEAEQDYFGMLEVFK